MYNAPVLKKGIEVLRLVTQTNEALGVSEISRRLSIVKSTTLGILKALEEEGLLAQDPVTKKYLPGTSLFEFSRKVLRSMELPFVAKPFLERLVELVDETVILAAREDDDTLRVLEMAEPKKELKITVPMGTRFPVYTGALMKVFLSQMKNEEIARFVLEKPLPRYTDHSAEEIEGLLLEVERAREFGYATDLEEYRKGVRGVAALVFRGSRARAAIAIFGLASSMEDRRMPDIILHIKNTAQSISRKLTLMARNQDGSDGGVGPSPSEGPSYYGSGRGA
ncbi:MAG: IclR family transcriptional regulator [Syntrophorhabdales bacterium]